MDESQELETKRAKLKAKLNKFIQLDDFDGYITDEMKADINDGINDEIAERKDFEDEEVFKQNELKGIKYK